MCARGSNRALLRGPSTHPLGIMTGHSAKWAAVGYGLSATNRMALGLYERRVTFDAVSRALSRLICSSVSVVLCLICGAVIPGCGAALAAQKDALIEGWDKLPASEIESRLPSAHPDNSYAYAGRLWREVRRTRRCFGCTSAK